MVLRYKQRTSEIDWAEQISNPKSKQYTAFLSFRLPNFKVKLLFRVKFAEEKEERGGTAKRAREASGKKVRRASGDWAVPFPN